MAGAELVVMAAGMGRRYGGLKQIDPVGPAGEILLDYAVYDAIQAGFEKIIFVIRRSFAEEFRQRFGRHAEAHADVAYVCQELDAVPDGVAVPAERQKPWGTGHAVLCAREAITGPFAVANADDFYGRGAFEALHGFLTSAPTGGPALELALVAYTLRNTLSEHGHVARGVCTATSDGDLASIVERTRIRPFDGAVRYSEDDGQTWHDVDPASPVSMNLWGFTPGILPELEQRFRAFVAARGDDPTAEFYVPTVVNELVQEGRARVRMLHTDERWFGMTYAEDKPRAQQAVRGLIERGVYPARLWEDGGG